MKHDYIGQLAESNRYTREACEELLDVVRVQDNIIGDLHRRVLLLEAGARGDCRSCGGEFEEGPHGGLPRHFNCPHPEPATEEKD